MACQVEAFDEGWWEALVTLQSSLPICFVTPDLQSGNWIASHGDPAASSGSGSGSHTHLRKFMRLPSVLWSSFPQ
jgi:hypothetical protein